MPEHPDEFSGGTENDPITFFRVDPELRDQLDRIEAKLDEVIESGVE